MFHWNQVIGIFGGSFDPPHAGHRAAAEGLLRLPGLKKVWILPSGNPPWKIPSTKASSRLEMTGIAFAGNSELQVQPWEMELAQSSPNQPTTTWRLLDFIRPKLQGAEVAWVIGADGMGSKVRAAIAPHSAVRYQGIRTWLGLSVTPA
ncbi:MAG: hypothetical protein EBS60_09525, partial [Verrucomicrobia bacterium]|nr:hypothetical protein [Verrucomicrobiota bacterium]